MVVTDTGKQKIVEWLIGNNPNHPNSIAIGTSSQTPSATDSSLYGEITRSSVSATQSNEIATFETTLDTTQATGNYLREIGLFNSTNPTSGDMFVRNTFAEIEKTNNVEVQFEQRMEVE